MPKSAKPLEEYEIQQIRQEDANIWEGRDPTYINLCRRLLCDVSEDNIPEPEKTKIILLIRQIGKKLQNYSA